MKSSPNEKHLEFIENTISRLSDKSFQTRAWCVTVVSALFAFVMSSDRASDIVSATGTLSVMLTCLFCALDTYYLYLERCYRYLYKKAAGILPNEPPEYVQNYSMDIPASQRGIKAYFRAMRKTVLFYGPLIVILICLTIFLYGTIMKVNVSNPTP